jgi:hypothetical protein
MPAFALLAASVYRIKIKISTQQFDWIVGDCSAFRGDPSMAERRQASRSSEAELVAQAFRFRRSRTPQALCGGDGRLTDCWADG